MPIPGKDNITEQHIRQAMEMIDRDGYEGIYKSTKYVLIVNGKCYPPKHVVRLANQLANGGTLDGLSFYPNEANRLLKRLKFVVQERHSTGEPPKDKRPPPPLRINRDKRINDILYELERILHSKRQLPPGTDLYGYITELSGRGDIPRRIAGLMHAIRQLRNDFTKKREELTDREFAALEASWAAIQEWAKKS